MQDPRKYIQALLTVHDKYESIVRLQFKNEVGFKAAHDRACAQFINRNAVSVKARNQNFSAEVLATFCHLLLKKSNRNISDAELEATLDQIILVFRFLEDKDVFEGFYKRRLADRLVRTFSTF